MSNTTYRMKDRPLIDRPQEKLQRYGVKKLSNAELLAIILRTGRKGEDVLTLAERLFRSTVYHPITGRIETSLNAYVHSPGIGPSKASQIVACLELGRRLFAGEPRMPLLRPKDIWLQLHAFRERQREMLLVLYLDVHHRELHRELLTMGVLSSQHVHPREIFEPALEHRASACILVHNHPSGRLIPSSQDIAFTKRIEKAAALMGIALVDHIIVSKEGYLSFVEAGYLKKKQS